VITQDTLEHLASARTTLDKGLDLLGRLAVAFLFVDAARYHLTSGWTPTLAQMHARGVPFPPILLVVAMLVSIALSVALVFGIKERLAALGLALYAIGVSAVMYNPFAHLGTVSLIFFMKDLCIFGALLSLSRVLKGAGRKD
jgi:putative oxidoreductase